jgi:DNA-directed RNA polymerase subunit M/transcription elongation factor TFIIS
MEDLRESVYNYILHIFNKFNIKYNLSYDTKKYAKMFEDNLYNMLSDIEYAKIVIHLDKYLETCNGYFSNDLLGIKYMQNIMTVESIMSYDLSYIDNNPRNKIISLFANLLYKYNSDKEYVLEIAKAIEKSCYNAIIKNSKQSEDPPCRQWDSAIFVEIYSNRCGIIYNLLDKESNTCKLYGSTLLDQILNKTIDVNEIGFKTERELCPQATEKEKNEIAIRSEQYVKEKESNLFKCPNCKERRVTYREVQLRALDEAPDYLCKCLNCEHRFKGR